MDRVLFAFSLLSGSVWNHFVFSRWIRREQKFESRRGRTALDRIACRVLASSGSSDRTTKPIAEVEPVDRMDRSDAHAFRNIGWLFTAFPSVSPTLRKAQPEQAGPRNPCPAELLAFEIQRLSETLALRHYRLIPSKCFWRHCVVNPELPMSPG